MRSPVTSALLALALAAPGAADAQEAPFDSLTAGLERVEGFVDYFYDDADGRVLLAVPAGLGDFIYVNSLAAGVGSNDLGLDRGQLGETRLVRFRKTGGKLLLEQPNLGYRAVSDNPAEQLSVAEAFASSVLAGLPILAAEGEGEGAEYLVDLTPWLLRDAHGVGRRLAETDQGTFELDPLRSAIYAERTRNFPRNTEFEALVTLAGKAQGRELSSVTPTPDAVTTRQHHSFVALPEPGYEPRAFDPRGGQYVRSYADYGSAIGEPLVRRFITRHRLEKVDPSAAGSAAVEPIVYYVDRGAPEPVRSALIEGASWWDQAFQAAGFAPGTFRVEVLPEGADPLDVRYNVIQWVHRSTRGWSYGNSVTDPRTGEILKGHVSLGSLRVRQDYLIAQGLIDAYADGETDPRMLEFALARLRQLSAHEVGHTLGLAHNFAASTDGRASVMDYPHPYVTLAEEGGVDLSEAYATGIGAWDKRSIVYSHGVFGEGEADSLRAVLAENEALGLAFVSDKDSRPRGGAHPEAHLWDNGADAAAELARVTEVRAAALARFDADNLAPGRPLAELENVFAPLYLGHRYQVEAAAKVVGGIRYDYGVNDGSPTPVEPVGAAEQAAAVAALTATLTPEFLRVPAGLLALIPPQPLGYERDRELFATRTSVVFDPWAAAEASVDHTLGYLLDPARVQRVLQQATRAADAYSGEQLADALLAEMRRRGSSELEPYRQIARARALEHALSLASDEAAGVHARAWARDFAEATVATAEEGDPLRELLGQRFRRWSEEPEAFAPTPGARIPDGSPIGCGG